VLADCSAPGFQLAWRTVYIIEYLGPFFAYPLIIAFRPYIYKNATGDMSTTQWLSCGMILLHFLKREYETIFVHKFSANTLPVYNVFKNSAHYWITSGLLCAYAICSPTSLAAKADLPAVDAVGVLVYILGEVCNLIVHLYLASLRSTGGTERRIPKGYGFELVTCPNYMYEVIAWAGIIIVSRSWAVVLFIVMGSVQMHAWAVGKEKTYRKEFGDKYKKKRYTMIPGLF
jgi:very-long-chain enoyl-CoA reductase